MPMLNSTNAKLARDSTLAALNVIASAIQAAAEALNAKATAINTGAISGTVALDVGTLAALEAINANIQGTVPVSIGGPVGVTGTFWQATQPVSFTWQGLTDAQLRAAAVPVSIGAPVAVTGTFWQATQPVSFTWQGLTDAQLRAAAVPVSIGTPVAVTGNFWQATQPVSFTWAGLTDAQLRATPVPMSADALPLPAGAATEATLAQLIAAVAAHDQVAADGHAGLVLLAKRRDSDAAAMVADGDWAFLSLDENQRLKVSSQPASYGDITGDITAVQATIGTPVVGGTVAGDVSRASNAMVFCTGTFAGVNCTFEGSLQAAGETNWFAVQAVRSNANTIELTTGVLAAQPAYAWELSVNALSRLRVRCTARTSGTQSWRFKLGTYATEPIPAAQISGTQPVSGTVTATANIGTSGLTVYTDSAANLAASATFTGTSRDGGATPAFNLFVANAYADVAGTLRVEKSTDNTTWRRASADVAVGAGEAKELVVRVTARYYRVVYVNGAGAQTAFLLTSAYQRI